ncbi:DUF1128 domain-containing protein [Listeria riparia]|uniref:Uncharacterized protein n=1 Tax=Listeria riparia FSL S10-1204 TaxID=1265816 RepID=W7DBX0_9LIST|nr:DUF1128 family protein [Listeria riparia]EUJ46590.1 hypothetical protein PRIP_02069 [Listeria riparia FSL S10-1204]
MNLEKPSQENVTYMLNEITSKLKMANASVFENLTLESIHYEPLVDIYTVIHRKKSISLREMQLFAEELRTIRK